MAVRSRYSSTSYLHNRPGAGEHAVRKRESAVMETGIPEICLQCPYKMIADGVIKQANAGIVTQPQQVVKKTSELSEVQMATTPITTTEQKPDEKKDGFFTKFQSYVKKNREANRKAGEAPLLEDLVKMGGKLAAGAAKLGEEEAENLEKKKKAKASVSREELDEKDEDTLDFLMGKKKPKK
jgi:hypothetical protein